MNDAEFAERYYEAWNARDLDAILALYADDIEFSSPYIAALGFSPDGVIHGKALLRLYFEKRAGARAAADVSRRKRSASARAATRLIYRNHRGERAAEAHEMDGAGLDHPRGRDLRNRRSEGQGRLSSEPVMLRIAAVCGVAAALLVSACPRAIARRQPGAGTQQLRRRGRGSQAISTCGSLSDGGAHYAANGRRCSATILER